MNNRISQAVEVLTRRGRRPLELHSPNHDWAVSHFPQTVLRRTWEDYIGSLDYHPDPKGDPAARKALVSWYRHHFSAGFDAGHLLFSAGTSESYAWIFRTLGAPGDKILAPAPSYPLFEHLASFSRLELDFYPLDAGSRWEPDLAALESRIDRKTRAILLVSPHNPTGAVLSHRSLERLEQLATRHSLALVFDEVFSSFIWDRDVSGASFPRPDAAKAPLVFTLNGASKAMALPWLKLAWVHVSGSDHARVERTVDELETLSDSFLPVNGYAQKALPELLGAAGGFVPEWREMLRGNREKALSRVREIRGLGIQAPQGGVMACLELEKGLSARFEDEEELVLALLEEAGVFLHPGYFFDHASGPLRLVFSFQHPEDELEDGLDRISDFFSTRC